MKQPSGTDGVRSIEVQPGAKHSMNRGDTDTSLGCFVLVGLAALSWGLLNGFFWTVLAVLAVLVLLLEVRDRYRIQHKIARRHLTVAVLLAVLVSGNDVYHYTHFKRMTVSQHLQAAREALSGMKVSDVERNLDSVPSSPESVELRRQLRAAQDAESLAATERQQQEERRAANKRADDEQGTRLADWLQRDLTQTGYDVKVSWSGSPSMITISSKDFENTDSRVRFLAHLRGKLSAWPCKVRLTSDGLFGESYGGIYDLNACWTGSEP
jgi:hypothetical protein